MPRDHVIEALARLDSFAGGVIAPSVLEEENFEPVIEERSQMGHTNELNQKTPLTHQAPINSTNEVLDSRSRSTTIIKESKFSWSH